MLKLLLLGDTNVGKTSMLHFFHRGRVLQGPMTTIGIDFVPVRDKAKKVFAHIWDSGGLERYRCINRHYYTGSHCVMIIYDASDTSKTAFNQVWPWYQDLVDMCGAEAVSKMPILIAGNKFDKLTSANPKVCDSLNSLLASKNQNFSHIFTSAFTGKNITPAFSGLLHECIKMQNSPIINSRTRVKIQEDRPKVIHCCY